MTYHFRLFFSNNSNGNKYLSFQDLHDPRGVIFQNFSINFYILWKDSGGYWYNHGMWYINLVCFFSTKTMRMKKIHFRHRVRKYDPWSWITPWLLCRDRPTAARRCACFYFSLTFFDVSRYLTLVHFLFSNYTSFAGRRCALIFLRLDCPARGYMAVWVRDSELCLQRVYTQTQSLLLLTHSHDASTHMNVYIYGHAPSVKSHSAPSLNGLYWWYKAKNIKNVPNIGNIWNTVPWSKCVLCIPRIK